MAVVLLPLDEFQDLRLVQFAPSDQLVELSNWEFLDQVWVGEALGFTEWLRPSSQPERLGSLSIDMSALDPPVTAAILARLGLPLRSGMSRTELCSLLGEPKQTLAFVPDRTSYEYVLGSPEPYYVSCTVLNSGGLMYVVVTAPRSLLA